MATVRSHAGGETRDEACPGGGVIVVETGGFGVILPAHCKSNDLVVEDNGKWRTASAYPLDQRYRHNYSRTQMPSGSKLKKRVIIVVGGRS